MCSTLFPCLMLPRPLSFCLNNPPKTTISKAKIALTQHALSVLALAQQYLFLFIFLSRRRGERGDTRSTGPRRNSSSTAEARVCDVSNSKSDRILVRLCQEFDGNWFCGIVHVIYDERRIWKSGAEGAAEGSSWKQAWKVHIIHSVCRALRDFGPFFSLNPKS